MSKDKLNWICSLLSMGLFGTLGAVSIVLENKTAIWVCVIALFVAIMIMVSELE